jgi:SAM-dependent methyltransferase
MLRRIGFYILKTTEGYMNNYWWDEAYGFFGEFYMEGDESIEGFITNRKLALSERTDIEVEGIIKLLKLTANEKIMDIPCGYGRHTIELAMRGYDIVGIDLNATHLHAALENAYKKNTNAKFMKGNMLNIDFENEFDVIINMFYSFGFFDTDEENMKVLKNFKKALRPNGKFLMHTDVNIPRIITGKYKTDELRHLKSGAILKIQDRYNSKTKRIDGAWTIENNSKVIEKKYSVRVYEEMEFRNMCIEAGFSSCIAYSGWDGREYNSDSEEIFFIAQN